MSILKPGAITEGAFVRTLVGQTGTGFQEGMHVHKDWYAKTLTYDQMHEMLESERGKRVDYTVPRSTVVAIAVANDIRIMVDGQEFNPTELALNHIGEKCDLHTGFLQHMRKPGTGYKTVKKVRHEVETYQRDEQDAAILASIINNGLRRVEPNKMFKVRTYSDGTMRAFLTDKYTEIDNRKYLDIIEKIIPGGRVSHFRGDADEIFANILIPDTIMHYPDDDSDYGGLVTCANSEIGTGRVNQEPSVFRSICMNGCIWGSTAGEKTSWVHRGAIDYEKLSAAMEKNITSQIPLLTPYIQQLLACKNYDLGGCRIVTIIGAIAQTFKLRKEQAIEIVKQFNQHESSYRNGFGIINAVTRAGQLFSPKTCHQFDAIGGYLVQATNWDKTVAIARTLDETDITTIFGDGLT